MAWVDVTYTAGAGYVPIAYKDAYGSDPSKIGTGVQLQYESSSSAPTPKSVKLRFKYYRNDGGSGNLKDSMYILLNPKSDTNRALYKLKGYTYDNSEVDAYTEKGEWVYYCDKSFTLSKNFDVSTFTIPEYWICNCQGWQESVNYTLTASAVYAVFSAKAGTSTDYGILGRDNLRCIVSSTTAIIDPNKTSADPITASNISLTLSDSGDNNCKVIAKADATSAKNNFITGFKIGYSFGEDTSYGSNLHNGSTGGTVTKYIDITTGNYKASNATRRVNVKCTVTPKYGNDITKVSSIEIKHYRVPSKPGKPVLTVGGKEVTANSGRATVKKDWVFSWAKAIAANSSSAIKGYRMYLYKNGTCIKICDKDGNARATDTWYYDSESTTPTITIYPSSNNLKVNDVVQLKICAYTKNGLETKLLGEYVASDEITIQNAGIVYVKIDGEWREGQVYVKISGNWKEAESISVKISGTWKEAT